MPLATIGSVLSIAGGINSLTGGGISQMLGMGGQVSGSQAQSAVNPMAPYQAQLAQMYQGYLQPGASVAPQNLPGFTQFNTGVLNPAMESSKASAAASGQTYSGAESAQLQSIGQKGYSGFMNDYLNRLYTGATGGAALGGQALTSQSNLNNQAFSQGLGA